MLRKLVECGEASVGTLADAVGHVPAAPACQRREPLPNPWQRRHRSTCPVRSLPTILRRRWPLSRIPHRSKSGEKGQKQKAPKTLCRARGRRRRRASLGSPQGKLGSRCPMVTSSRSEWVQTKNSCMGRSAGLGNSYSEFQGWTLLTSAILFFSKCRNLSSPFYR